MPDVSTIDDRFAPARLNSTESMPVVPDVTPVKLGAVSDPAEVFVHTVTIVCVDVAPVPLTTEICCVHPVVPDVWVTVSVLVRPVEIALVTTATIRFPATAGCCPVPHAVWLTLLAVWTWDGVPTLVTAMTRRSPPG